MHVVFVERIIFTYRWTLVWLSEEAVRCVLQWELIVSNTHPKAEEDPVNDLARDIKHLGWVSEVVPAIIADHDDLNWEEAEQTRKHTETMT